MAGKVEQARPSVQVAAVQTDDHASRGSTRNIGTQTDGWRSQRRGREVDEEQRRVEAIWSKLEGGPSYEVFSELLTKEWPESAYRRTKLETGFPKWASTEEDVAIIGREEQGEDDLAVQASKRCAVARALVGKGLESGKVVYGRCSRQVILDADEVEEEGTRYTFILPFAEFNLGNENYEQVFRMLTYVAIKMREKSRASLCVTSQEGMDRESIRKIVECVFNEGTEEVRILCPPGARSARATVTGEQQASWAIKPKRSTEVLIQVGGRTYVDVLREMREKVQVKYKNIPVTAVRKTKNGDLMETVKGDRTKAEELRHEVERAIKVKANVRREDATVLIYGLDPASTEEEIEAAFARELGMQDGNIGEIIVKRLRADANDSQMAVVNVAKEAALVLAAKGKVEIGWTRCRVKMKTDLIRCFRFLEFGHRAGVCKGSDRSKACMRCGEDGHKAQDVEGKSSAFCAR